VVANAVMIEPVSHPKFPANREINKEFSIFWALECKRAPEDHIFQLLRANSLRIITGN